ncbi:hypothetical protein [Campylobacter geochelonis]|uniref:Uncharacterized protein n=1 Tax=Campylobacter geochelonis TaxID=1780362 RepID=A0A128EF14_9BACT|nr:hypothetical protein [Campylobacter geochelonis]QKF71000.1 hypothetical protein CGEO_0679 [Campylobacter geochelonis]CZE47131.1 Uncharacterised protein [Campylobacter geochelonis]CZE47606.1 Uncharacterised protein [Campylobacter geochelonis]CZE50184.1 Uncharacterised protein [Campylobacter geochelonis]
MTKNETIAQLEKVINQQTFVTTRIKNCITLKREQEIRNIVGSEEEFGKFFYDKNNRFEELLNSILYDGITKYYEEWKHQCHRIYGVYLADITNPAKSKFNKITPKELDIVESYYDDLMSIHKKGVVHFKTAVERLHALSEEKFKSPQ